MDGDWGWMQGMGGSWGWWGGWGWIVVIVVAGLIGWLIASARRGVICHPAPL